MPCATHESYHRKNTHKNTRLPSQARVCTSTTTTTITVKMHPTHEIAHGISIHCSYAVTFHLPRFVIAVAFCVNHLPTRMCFIHKHISKQI